jgi:hypothetical protein
MAAALPTLYTVTVKEGTPWTVADFESTFAGKGVKIQPTRENKPTSQITILRFGNFDEIAKLCTEVTGGAASIIARDLPAELMSLEVHFNKSKLSLHLQITLETDDNYQLESNTIYYYIMEEEKMCFAARAIYLARVFIVYFERYGVTLFSL